MKELTAEEKKYIAQIADLLQEKKRLLEEVQKYRLSDYEDEEVKRKTQEVKYRIKEYEYFLKDLEKNVAKASPTAPIESPTAPVADYKKEIKEAIYKTDLDSLMNVLNKLIEERPDLMSFILSINSTIYNLNQYFPDKSARIKDPNFKTQNNELINSITELIKKI